MSSVEPFLAQQSRPVSPRESAKRHSVRAHNTNWLRGGDGSSKMADGSTSSRKGRRRTTSARIAEQYDEDNSSDNDHDGSVMQMSVSQYPRGDSGDDHDNNLTVEVSMTNDPSSLSPNPSSDHDRQKDIYHLGVLSPAHLDKQPAAAKISPNNNACAGQQHDPQAIVKVQFVQSGGKVIKLTTTPATPRTPSDHHPNSTPRKQAKQKLTSLAKKVLSSSSKTTPQSSSGGKKKKRVGTIANLVGSRYHTFAGDDTDHDDDGEQENNDDDDNHDDNAGLLSTEDEDRGLSNWKEVDAAIPVLQL